MKDLKGVLVAYVGLSGACHERRPETSDVVAALLARRRARLRPGERVVDTDPESWLVREAGMLFREMVRLIGSGRRIRLEARAPGRGRDVEERAYVRVRRNGVADFVAVFEAWPVQSEERNVLIALVPLSEFNRWIRRSGRRRMNDRARRRSLEDAEAFASDEGPSPAPPGTFRARVRPLPRVA